VSTKSTRLARRFFLLVAILTVLLGMVGYWRAPLTGHQDGLNAAPGFWRLFDYLYMSLQLLVLSGRDVRGEPVLLVARWFGVLFAFGVIVRLLTPRIGEWLVRLWIRWFLSGHTVVIGLSTKGRLFLLDAARDHRTSGVVAIDLRSIDDDETLRDPAMSDAEWKQLRKHLYLIRGDAGERDSLSQLNLRHAARVYVATQNDALNVELARKIALHIGAHRPEDKPLTVYVHIGQAPITDDLLANLKPPPAVIVRPFSLPSIAARTVLARWPLAIAAREQGARCMGLAFIGFDEYAAAVLVHALRLGALGGQGRPRITIFTDAAAAVRERLDKNYPALGELAEHLDIREHDPTIDLTEAELADVEGRDGPTPVTAIFVVAAADAEAFLLARRVRRITERAGRWRAPLFVRLQRTEPYGRLPTLAECKVLADVIEPFGELKSLCGEAALRDWHERLAQELHADYRKARPNEAAPDRSSPADRPWDELSEEFREANRRAIDHFPLKLATAGWIARDEMPLLGGPLALDDAAVDALARLEHQSWTNEKLLAGWRPHAERDDRRRFHDYLVDYEQLGSVQQRDISQSRSIEALLQAPAERAVSAELAQRREKTGTTVFRERVIGLAGHNLISLANAREIRKAIPALLESLDAGQRLGPRGEEFWTFITPLAPGADYLLSRRLGRALARESGPIRRYRLLIVRGLPPRGLARAYLERAAGRPDVTPDGETPITDGAFSQRTPEDSVTGIANLLSEFANEERACERVIELVTPQGPESDAARLGFEAANRYLLERCDDLVVAIDPARYGERRPFDLARWQGLDPQSLPAAGTGALVSAWLRRTPRRYTAVRPLSPTGLHWIELDDQR
jgi:hypothetical protein